MTARQTIVLSGLTITVARGFWQRLVGLLGQRSLPAGRGLLLTRCNNIHTAFMRFPIDAVFLDEHGAVLAIRAQMGPFRAAVSRRASACLEIQSGAAAANGIEVGHRLVPLLVALEGGK
jgi:uncharacterized membrane protein (UPF0127 family)